MHLMIDFETLDTKPSAVVLSVGLVLFNETRIVSTKYFKFHVQSQLDAGRTVSAKTIAWWIDQSNAAKSVLQPKQNADITLVTFNDMLTEWLLENGANTEDLHVWGNGAAFDLPILDSITEPYGPIYDHWNARCFREFARNGCKQLVIRTGTHHNALDDAIYQTECVLAQWAKERGTK